MFDTRGDLYVYLTATLATAIVVAAAAIAAAWSLHWIGRDGLGGVIDAFIWGVVSGLLGYAAGMPVGLLLVGRRERARR